MSLPKSTGRSTRSRLGQEGRVTVLNQFALGRGAAGGTRHIELFERCIRWRARVIAGSRTTFDQSRVEPEGILETVWVAPYRGNGPSRVINWLSYCVTAMLRALWGRRPDVVYASSPHLGTALSGLLLARLQRAALVLEIRDLWPHILAETGVLSEQSLPYRLLKALEGFLYRKADAIVILAEGSRRAIEAEGIPSERIHFVPNGADVVAPVSSNERSRLRDELGFDGFVVVYTGAHGPANGLDFVLDAAEELAWDPDVRFVLFGAGVAKPKLVDEAVCRGLSSIDFRDPVAKHKVWEILAAADVGLHCLADVELFTYGVSPNKLYDYMASGLPVVTNTIGEVAEMVEQADAGIACLPDGIAKAVGEMHALSDTERARFGANGQAFMKAERSRAAMAITLTRVLDIAIKRLDRKSL